MSKSSSGPSDCCLAGLARSQALSSGAHRAQYVIPYGIGGNPFGVDVFGSAMQLFDQIAARVLGPGRSDASPANANDGKMARGRTYAIECLWGVALLSEPGSEHSTTARIHLRDPSVDRNSGTLDLVILDDRAPPVGGVAPL
jgi:hypothetical protein